MCLIGSSPRSGEIIIKNESVTGTIERLNKHEK